MSQKAITRRNFLTRSSALAGAAAGGVALSQATPAAAGAKGAASAPADALASAFLDDAVVAFDADHQAGIETPGQALLNMVAFTLVPGKQTREDVARLMRVWTEDARRLTSGVAPMGDLEPELTWSTANLTITCGVGASLLDKLGLQDKKPTWLAPIKAFSRDKLEPQWGEADLVLQICADDPLTLSHATRHMMRSAQVYATTFWMQSGFLNAKGAIAQGATPRNLFGFVDGTVNPSTRDDFDAQVWIDEADTDQQWLVGGTCMVVRRIYQDMEEWDKLDRLSRNLVFGRDQTTGAPLSGGEEKTDADYAKTDDTGLPVIDPHSHMAMSANSMLHGPDQMKRRAYNYDLAPQPGDTFKSNQGLIFICFQKDPIKQFTTIQERLDAGDRLNQWITHIGSAVFAILPGTGAGRDTYWGQRLWEA